MLHSDHVPELRRAAWLAACLGALIAQAGTFARAADVTTPVLLVGPVRLATKPLLAGPRTITTPTLYVGGQPAKSAR